MNVQRRTEPTKGLLQGGKYTPAIQHIPQSNPLWDKFKDKLPKEKPSCETSSPQS